jgi:ABC-type sugar transport system substrate-binding protein
MMTFRSALLMLMLLTLLGIAGPASAQKSVTLQIPAETSYQNAPTLASDTMVPIGPKGSLETTYNPLGTTSESNFALISNRRGEPTFQGFLAGMQTESLRLTGKALNVAPLSAESLEQQAEVLKQRGVDSFIVDSPRAADAATFLKNSKLLAMKIVLITREAPEGDLVYPTVVDQSISSGGPAATRVCAELGSGDGRVLYLLGESPEQSPAARQQLKETFLAGLRDAKGKEDVTEVNDNVAVKPTDVKTVFCALTPWDTSAIVAYRTDFKDAIFFGAGESPAIQGLTAEGLLQYRIFPDHGRLFGEALRRMGKAPGTAALALPAIEPSPKHKPAP